MKYKVGDKVRIKNLDWYNQNKDVSLIESTNSYYNFIEVMQDFCGKVMTISSVNNDYYDMVEDAGEYFWTDEMIEGLVEEESEKKLSDESWKPSKEEMDVLYGLAYITNQYDEHKEEVIARLYQDLKREFFNGSSYENMFPNTENDVRRRSTIQVLEYARSLDNYNQYGKADIDKNIAWLEKQGKSALEARTDNELIEEEVGLVDKFSSRWVNEFNLPEGYVLKDENGNVINATKIVLEKKKKEYPKTYEECNRIMGVELWNTLWGEDATEYEEQIEDLIDAFIRLKVCRDAYWKIAGEEMGLGKPWKPDWTDQESPKYCITSIKDQVEASKRYYIMNTILAFPTEEMRDAFYENFKSEIESCNELL